MERNTLGGTVPRKRKHGDEVRAALDRHIRQHLEMSNLRTLDRNLLPWTYGDLAFYVYSTAVGEQGFAKEMLKNVCFYKAAEFIAVDHGVGDKISDSTLKKVSYSMASRYWELRMYEAIAAFIDQGQQRQPAPGDAGTAGQNRAPPAQRPSPANQASAAADSAHPAEHGATLATGNPPPPVPRPNVRNSGTQTWAPASNPTARESLPDHHQQQRDHSQRVTAPHPSLRDRSTDGAPPPPPDPQPRGRGQAASQTANGVASGCRLGLQPRRLINSPDQPPTGPPGPSVQGETHGSAGAGPSSAPPPSGPSSVQIKHEDEAHGTVPHYNREVLRQQLLRPVPVPAPAPRPLVADLDRDLDRDLDGDASRAGLRADTSCQTTPTSKSEREASAAAAAAAAGAAAYRGPDGGVPRTAPSHTAPSQAGDASWQWVEPGAMGQRAQPNPHTSRPRGGAANLPPPPPPPHPPLSRWGPRSAGADGAAAPESLPDMASQVARGGGGNSVARGSGGAAAGPSGAGPGKGPSATSGGAAARWVEPKLEEQKQELPPSRGVDLWNEGAAGPDADRRRGRGVGSRGWRPASESQQERQPQPRPPSPPPQPSLLNQQQQHLQPPPQQQQQQPLFFDGNRDAAGGPGSPVSVGVTAGTWGFVGSGTAGAYSGGSIGDGIGRGVGAGANAAAAVAAGVAMTVTAGRTEAPSLRQGPVQGQGQGRGPPRAASASAARGGEAVYPTAVAAGPAAMQPGAAAAAAEHPPMQLLRKEFKRRAALGTIETKLRKHLLKKNNSKIKKYCLKEGTPWTLLDLACYGVAMQKLAPELPLDFRAAVLFLALVNDWQPAGGQLGAGSGAAAGGGNAVGQLRGPHQPPPPELVDRVAAAMVSAADKYDIRDFLERQRRKPQRQPQQQQQEQSHQGGGAAAGGGAGGGGGASIGFAGARGHLADPPPQPRQQPHHGTRVNAAAVVAAAGTGPGPSQPHRVAPPAPPSSAGGPPPAVGPARGAGAPLRGALPPVAAAGAAAGWTAAARNLTSLEHPPPPPPPSQQQLQQQQPVSGRAAAAAAATPRGAGGGGAGAAAGPSPMVFTVYDDDDEDDYEEVQDGQGGAEYGGYIGDDSDDDDGGASAGDGYGNDGDNNDGNEEEEAAAAEEDQNENDDDDDTAGVAGGGSVVGSGTPQRRALGPGARRGVRSRRRARGTTAAAGAGAGRSRSGASCRSLEGRLRAHLRALGNSKLRQHNLKDGLGWSLLELVLADRDVRLQQGCNHLRPVDVAQRIARAKLPPGQQLSNATLQVVTRTMREAHAKYQLGPFVEAELRRRRQRATGPAAAADAGRAL